MTTGIKINLCIILICSMICGTAAAAEPDSLFLNYNLRSVYHGIGEGGTVSLNVTLKDFIDLGLKQGTWERVSDSEWIFRVSKIDQLSGQEKVTSFEFVRVADFFKDDVLLNRMMINDIELSQEQIYQYSGMIASDIYPLTKSGKLAAEKEKVQQQLDEEARVREKEKILTQQKQEEQRKIDEINRKKKEEEESVEIARQKMLESVQGEFVNYNGKKIAGEFNISLRGEKEIVFSGYNSSLERKCEIKDKIAVLEDFDIYRNKIQATYSQEGCILKLVFGEYSDAAALVQKATHYFEMKAEGCKSYCERGGMFTGRYSRR